MRDPMVDRRNIVEQLENTRVAATELHQYVLAYLIDHAIAEAWTSEFPSIDQLLADHLGAGTAP